MDCTPGHMLRERDVHMIRYKFRSCCHGPAGCCCKFYQLYSDALSTMVVCCACALNVDLSRECGDSGTWKMTMLKCAVDAGLVILGMLRLVLQLHGRHHPTLPSRPRTQSRGTSAAGLARRSPRQVLPAHECTRARCLLCSSRIIVDGFLALHMAHRFS